MKARSSDAAASPPLRGTASRYKIRAEATSRRHAAEYARRLSDGAAAKAASSGASAVAAAPASAAEAADAVAAGMSAFAAAAPAPASAAAAADAVAAGVSACSADAPAPSSAAAAAAAAAADMSASAGSGSSSPDEVPGWAPARGKSFGCAPGDIGLDGAFIRTMNCCETHRNLVHGACGQRIRIRRHATRDETRAAQIAHEAICGATPLRSGAPAGAGADVMTMARAHARSALRIYHWDVLLEAESIGVEEGSAFSRLALLPLDDIKSLRDATELELAAATAQAEFLGTHVRLRALRRTIEASGLPVAKDAVHALAIERVRARLSSDAAIDAVLRWSVRVGGEAICSGASVGSGPAGAPAAEAAGGAVSSASARPSLASASAASAAAPAAAAVAAANASARQ